MTETGTWLLRWGGTWRRVGRVSAAVVVLAGIAYDRADDAPTAWSVSVWSGMMASVYDCGLLLWPVARPVFGRLFRT